MHRGEEVELWDAHSKDGTECPERLHWMNSKARESTRIVVDMVVFVDGIDRRMMEAVVLPEGPSIREGSAKEHLNAIVGITSEKCALLNRGFPCGDLAISLHS